MKRNTVSGLALILGSICFLITMGLHPTSGSLDGLVQEASIRVGTHSLGLVSIAVTFFGMLGLHSRLQSDVVYAPAALVAYAFASVAAMCAAVINGLAAPAFATRMAPDPNLHETARAILTYSSQLNAGFARVFMVGVAAALVLWAISIGRTHALPRWAAWLGGLSGIAGLVGVLGGFLGVGVHEFGAFILGFAVWTIPVGVLLLRSSGAERVA